MPDEDEGAHRAEGVELLLALVVLAQADADQEADGQGEEERRDDRGAGGHEAVADSIPTTRLAALR